MTLSVYVVLFIIFFVTPDVFWLNAYKFMLPFFVGGFYYAKTDSTWINKNKVGLVATFVWIILMCFYSKETYIYTTGITLLGKASAIEQIVVDIYRYIIGMTGIVVVTFWFKIVYHIMSNTSNKFTNFMIKILEKCGRDSLSFYILSTYLFVWIMPVLTAAFQLNYLVVLIETIAVMIICSMLKKILSKVGRVSHLIIGR